METIVTCTNESKLGKTTNVWKYEQYGMALDKYIKLCEEEARFIAIINYGYSIIELYQNDVLIKKMNINHE